MAAKLRETCLWPGCDKLEELAHGRSQGGLCSGHRYRKRRGLPMEPPLSESLGHRLNPWQALHQAALDVAAACDDVEAKYAAACWRLRRRAEAFTRALDGKRRSRRGRKVEACR